MRALLRIDAHEAFATYCPELGFLLGSCDPFKCVLGVFVYTVSAYLLLLQLVHLHLPYNSPASQFTEGTWIGSPLNTAELEVTLGLVLLSFGVGCFKAADFDDRGAALPQDYIFDVVDLLKYLQERARLAN